MNALLALTLTASISAPAPVSPSPDIRRVPLAVQAAALAEAPPINARVPAATAALRRPGGDSLKNGAIIGGVVGAVGWGGFVYWLCRALDDTGGDANCAGPSLVWAGIAGAAGAAIGAGVDALFDGRPFGAPTGKNQPGRILPVGALSPPNRTSHATPFVRAAIALSVPAIDARRPGISTGE